uniref:Uncharacterized protein n=1 Tax=Oryza sativa subsp. japonica TaxID=39947 RepID=Q10ME1_ORYSJ|nr:hypothetical protein LOC_Os03g19830 [Oryza sativa Japonica Group]
MARGGRGGEGASRERWHEGMCTAEDTECTEDEEEEEERENPAALVATEPPAPAANFLSLREVATGAAGGKSKRKKGVVSRRTWLGRGPVSEEEEELQPSLRIMVRSTPERSRPVRHRALGGASVDEKIEHTSLGDLLSSSAGPKVVEMRACQSV